MTHKNRKKSRIFMFLSTGCSLLFLIKKIEIKFPAINFFQFQVIKPWIRIRNQKKCWIRIRIRIRNKSMRIRNPGSFRHTIGPRQSGSNEKLVSSYWLKFATLCLFVKRQCLFIKLQQPQTEKMSFTENDTFKLQITLDRHYARPRLNYYVLPDPPHFCYHLLLRRPIAIFDIKKTIFFSSIFSILNSDPQHCCLHQLMRNQRQILMYRYRN